eukprot:3567402-Pyramimonas_sp.AAC.2
MSKVELSRGCQDSLEGECTRACELKYSARRTDSFAEGEREYTRSGYQYWKGRENMSLRCVTRRRLPACARACAHHRRPLPPPQELSFQGTYRVGVKVNSQVLIANAWHHRSDALSSIAALVGPPPAPP